MKKIFIINFILIYFIIGQNCFCTEQPIALKKIENINKAPAINQQATQPIQPQPVDFGVCSKRFSADTQKLFYLTLAGINANRFKIDEIQSKSGYILFSVSQRQYLASVIKVDNTRSLLKITPCNNIYYFPVGIVLNMFKYIELNINTPIEKLPTV